MRPFIEENNIPQGFFKGNSVKRFQRSCVNKLCSVVSFILAKFLSSKRVYLREKKWNQNFLWICTSSHYVLHIYKVSQNSVERFQRSCANKKNRTDGQTDWLTDGSKTLYPPQLVAWGIINSMSPTLKYMYNVCRPTIFKMGKIYLISFFILSSNFYNNLYIINCVKGNWDWVVVLFIKCLVLSKV